MENLHYDSHDCICALATPWGKGAIGMIRLSGEDCIQRFSTLFTPAGRLLAAAGNSLVHGRIRDGDSDQYIDEVMVGVYRGPRSYTGQDSLEIMCHGSLPGIRSILDLLRRNGFRDAGPGEFTMRAFLNGKIDLTQAEAVNELIGAKTRASHDLAFRRLNGGIQKRIEGMRQALIALMAQVEVQLDYPEDEVDLGEALDFQALERVAGEIETLLGSYRTGKLYRDGLRIALAGPTNAGKSSLFNLFVKEDRAIVSDIHGTTRDYLQELLTLRGIPVTLIDTAGLRDSRDSIEAQGIERSRELIAGADLVLFVRDASQPPREEDDREYQGWRERHPRTLGVWNKIDLPGGPAPQGFVPISALSGEGFDLLEDRILEQIHKEYGGGDWGQVIDSDRQKGLLQEALEALGHVKAGIDKGLALDMIAVDLQDALRALGEITGEVSSGEILAQMFSGFCVGK